MATKRDYYEVLGVTKGATDQQIKAAYRKLAKQYHPDVDPSDAAKKKFEEIGEAYEVLSDPEKRKQYDQFGHAAFDGTAGQGNPFSGGFGGFRGFSGGDGTYYYSSNGQGMGDMFGDIFGEMFGKGAGRSGAGAGRGFNGFGGFGGRSNKGADITQEINVPFETAALGGDQNVRVVDPSSGKRTLLQVKVPAGMEEGKSIRLRGKGQPAPVQGGSAGDLFLKVHIMEKEGYERKGSDIYVTTFVPFATATLGGEAKVSTLYGDVMCKIPAGTQSGSKIRLRGKGAPLMRDPSRRGDEFAVIQIEVPKNMSPEATKRLKAFAEVI